jgi:hypothetical protein
VGQQCWTSREQIWEGEEGHSLRNSVHCATGKLCRQESYSDLCKIDIFLFLDMVEINKTRNIEFVKAWAIIRHKIQVPMDLSTRASKI